MTNKDKAREIAEDMLYNWETGTVDSLREHANVIANSKVWLTTMEVWGYEWTCITWTAEQGVKLMKQEWYEERRKLPPASVASLKSLGVWAWNQAKDYYGVNQHEFELGKTVAWL